MNWLKSIKQLLGRFWADLFGDGDFLLGVEYLLFLYSKLTDNQYLNWRNGMIAADMSVMPDKLPYTVLIEVNNIVREWYPWTKLWEIQTAAKFVNHTYASTADENSMGWIAYSATPIDDPDYLIDHLYGYNKILLRGLDYDVHDGRFLFYVDPADLGLPKIKVTDENGALHIYYRVFGIANKTQKVCDPVTGFESSWLNPCSDIAWDIHQNGATYYNTKQLLAAATGSVICTNDGVVGQIWDEQDYHCMSVDGVAYMSKTTPNYAVGASVKQGDVLFGSLAVYKGTDSVSGVQVPGIKVMTDAGALTALNATAEVYTVSGVHVLPLSGSDAVKQLYKDVCAANAANPDCPYVQVGTYNESEQRYEVNPYEFITAKLRRGRAVTIRLVASGLDYLAAAINCIRKSSCASGMINVYVAAETDDNSDSTLITSVFSATAGMMAVAVDETLTIQAESAEASVQL